MFLLFFLEEKATYCLSNELKLKIFFCLSRINLCEALTKICGSSPLKEFLNFLKILPILFFLFLLFHKLLIHAQHKFKSTQKWFSQYYKIIIFHSEFYITNDITSMRECHTYIQASERKTEKCNLQQKPHLPKPLSPIMCVCDGTI